MLILEYLYVDIFLYDILIFYFIKDKIVLVCDYFIVKVIIFYINSILIL